MIGVSDDDWRLGGDKDDLMHRHLKWMVWPVEDEDHDHCSFCWAKIHSSDWGPPVNPTEDDAPVYSAAWITADDERDWICPVCFVDFRDRFAWTTEPTG